METSFLAYVRGRTRHLRQTPLRLGIGDDAAVLQTRGQTVLCTDQIIDGVDFRLDEIEHWKIGFKAVAINISDLAAMGSIADSILVTMALPKSSATQLAAEVYEGIIAACEHFDLSIAGGDLSTYDGPLSISVTAVGHLEDAWQPWTRFGANVGDDVYVTGPVGGSLLGRHLTPRTAIDLVPPLREKNLVTAAIDISDGLSLDLDRLCAASGVGIRLDESSIPVHDDAIRRSEQSGQTPFRHAWSDGEDFELILAMPPQAADDLGSLTRPLHRIGTLTTRMGLWTDRDGKLIRLSPQGYVHGDTDPSVTTSAIGRGGAATD